eukprot:1939520-Karenia_brevis.AAC.1
MHFAVSSTKLVVKMYSEDVIKYFNSKAAGRQDKEEARKRNEKEKAQQKAEEKDKHRAQKTERAAGNARHPVHPLNVKKAESEAEQRAKTDTAYHQKGKELEKDRRKRKYDAQLNQEEAKKNAEHAKARRVAEA